MGFTWSSRLPYCRVVPNLLLCWGLTAVLMSVGQGQNLPTRTDTQTESRNTSVSGGLFHAHIHTEENGNVTFNVSADLVTLEESQFFLEKLFNKYGDKRGLTPAGLETMFHHLGLGEKQGESRRKRTLETKHVHSSHDECLAVDELLEAFHLATDTRLTPEQFTYLCPALVYQLDLGTCRLKSDQDDHTRSYSDGHSEADAHTDDKHEDHTDEHIKVEDTNAGFDLGRIPGKVWGFSTVAVIIISLVGLLGVAVIPIMQKVFYNHLLQFLVALAVGALSGDALLHLLPHSIMSDTTQHNHGHDPHAEEDAAVEEEHNHTSAAWKGLMALAGILFFFVTERMLTIITVIKRNRNSKKQKKKKRCEKFCDIESNKKSVGSKLSHKEHDEDECDRTVMLIHPNKALKSYADAAHEEFMHQCNDDVTSIGSGSKQSQMYDPQMEMMDMSKQEEEVAFGHSHGHGHGHAHSVPTSVAAVAWMVILGDGIHNFSDGLAIGAAFANSITGGFSTSIAVFCHELPHEIGDFAVLLRAGMTIKQAVLYNCLSSILCFIGMLIGVSIGNISSASLWIFAAVGGMFLYIALVDMLPEMSSVDPKKGENPFLHLLLQVIGILLGSGIMLLVALFEHDIKQAFG